MSKENPRDLSCARSAARLGYVQDVVSAQHTRNLPAGTNLSLVLWVLYVINAVFCIKKLCNISIHIQRYVDIPHI